MKVNHNPPQIIPRNQSSFLKIILKPAFSICSLVCLYLQELLQVHHTEMHCEEESGEVIPRPIHSDHYLRRPTQPPDPRDAPGERGRDVHDVHVRAHRSDPRLQQPSRDDVSNASHDDNKPRWCKFCL